jgi:hypothetical protein
MANEITATATLRVAKSGFDQTVTRTKSIDMTGTHFNYTVQNIGTTAEALSLGDVATPGMIYVRNTDASNYVEIGRTISATWQPFALVRAGEVAMFRSAASITLQGKANGSACDCEVWIVED